MKSTRAAHASAETPKPEVAAATPATVTTAASPATPSSGAAVPFITRPPAGTTMPVRPAGWTPRAGEDYRGTQPKKAELSTLAAAIDDLKRFAPDYASVLGTTAPALDHVLELLEAANEWSASRVATANWDVFARAQEGLAWGGIRAVMDTLRPAFDLAVKGNRGLSIKLPGLASLLDAQKVIARKGASTRRANRADQAEGKAPTHGKVGKARKNAAAKVALAASEQSTAGATPAQSSAAATTGNGPSQAGTQADAASTTAATPTH